MSSEEKETIVDFKTIKEDWEIYECYDGTMIKFKVVLILIVKSPEKNEQGKNLYWFNSHNVIGLYSPIEIRGSVDRIYPVDELEEYVVEKNIMFRTIQDSEFNIYETEDFILRMSTNVRSIDKTDKYDQRGMPQYIIRSVTQVIVEEKVSKVTP